MKLKPLLQLREFLPYRLSVLSNRISRDIAESYREEFGLPQREWRIMATIGEQPGLAARDVVNFTAMDKVAVSRAVNTMIEKKLITRSFANDDKRRSELKLSAKGEAIYNKIVPLALDYEKAIMDKLNEEEKKLLDTMIKKLMDIQEHVKD